MKHLFQATYDILHLINLSTYVDKAKSENQKCIKIQYFSHALTPADYTPMRLIYGFFWAKGAALAGSAKVRQTAKKRI